jgi:hypothetical protein
MPHTDLLLRNVTPVVPCGRYNPHRCATMLYAGSLVDYRGVALLVGDCQCPDCAPLGPWNRNGVLAVRVTREPDEDPDFPLPDGLCRWERLIHVRWTSMINVCECRNITWCACGSVLTTSQGLTSRHLICHAHKIILPDDQMVMVTAGLEPR